LIIFGSVSLEQKLLADFGNIHVLRALRGRAIGWVLKGCGGSNFCKSMEAGTGSIAAILFERCASKYRLEDSAQVFY